MRIREPAPVAKGRPAAIWGAISLVALLLGQSAHAAQTTSPYQRYMNEQCTSAACYLYLNPNLVAAGTRLDIDNVSCHLRSTGEMAYLRLLALAPSYKIVGGANLVPVLTRLTPGGEYSYAANHTVSMTARAGQGFVIQAATNTGEFTAVACQISGQLVRL